MRILCNINLTSIHPDLESHYFPFIDINCRPLWLSPATNFLFFYYFYFIQIFFNSNALSKQLSLSVVSYYYLFFVQCTSSDTHSQIYCVCFFFSDKNMVVTHSQHRKKLELKVQRKALLYSQQAWAIQFHTHAHNKAQSMVSSVKVDSSVQTEEKLQGGNHSPGNLCVCVCMCVHFFFMSSHVWVTA